MKATKSIIGAFLLCVTSAIGQDVEGFERVYYTTPAPIDVTDYTLEVKNPVAQADHCKMALKIANTSNDFILYKSLETTFNYSFGTPHPDNKPILVKPNDSKTRTLTVNGGDKFLQKTFTVEVGGVYKIPVDGTTTEVPNFQLPASTNSVTSGNFKIELKKYSASTKEAKAEFEVTYLGNEVALVNPANLSVKAKRNKSEEEVTYANDDKKGEAEILRKGEKVTVTAVFHIPGKIVDMQFAVMHILWNNTFVETSEVLLPVQTFTFEMDEALTTEKK